MIKCFDPIYNKDSKLLILGSAPSVQSLKKGEFYGNEQNRFWRLLFDLLGEEYSSDYSKKKKLILDNRIALWDTAFMCEREGSLDSNIKNVTFSDLPWLVEQTKIDTLILNGGAAKRFFYKAKYVFEREITVYELPSTSPANAKFSYEMLKESYSVITAALKK